ncbi:jg10103 [Pararge aegeria aegeria]|uniref:Jg10103 protein n=1 Tax=Pararge aegeria aegeria TaxID=348720 RepID=A0A8S4SBE5_9NEOP|nr:jg10103 [Pararge aegeria aegeria]
MADERLVVLNRCDNLGFGFSLLGEAGLPHIIYEIEENSPAARSGEVEAGDVLLKVNGTDVDRFTTREELVRGSTTAMLICAAKQHCCVPVLRAWLPV